MSPKKSSGQTRLQLRIEQAIGKPDSVTGDETNYQCPKCKASHLHINYKKGVCLCHGCNFAFRNLKNLLRDLGVQFTDGDAEKILGGQLSEVFSLLREEMSDDVPLALPEEFKRLYAGIRDPYHKLMYNYVRSRAVTDKQIEDYGIGYCEEGRYQGCVVIPVYVASHLVFFTSRRVLSAGSKNLNPAIGESKRYVLLGYDRCLEDEPKNIYITEGPFDMFAVENAGFHSVCVMGSTITREQAALLSKIPATLTVVFDPDTKDKVAKWASILADNTPNSVRLCQLPGENDLGEYAEEGKFKTMRKVLDRAKDFSIVGEVESLLEGI